MSSPRTPALLVIDDDPAILPLIERFARPRGFDVHTRGTGAEGLAAVQTLRPAVTLVDLRIPGLDGLEVLRQLRAADPDCNVILMTGHVSVETAITAVKAGALDYVSKPLDFTRLGDLLDQVKGSRETRERLLDVEAEVAKEFEFHGLIGRSPEMHDLFERIRRLAPHVRTALITGETGTGKECVARALHAEGPRRTRPFLTMNWSIVNETLFQDETFANGGTLFLDEASHLPPALQAKLLRLVEHSEIRPAEAGRPDVCIIAATTGDLRSAVAEGRFRSDLYYRLSTIEIALAPLRTHAEDIPYLTAALIREFAGRLKRPIAGITAAAERYLQEAQWPGNVRELRNVIERACLFSDNRILNERDIVAASSAPSGSSTVGEPAADRTGTDATLLSTAQRDQIRRALREAGGNKAVAARLLGVSRRSLYRWLERLKIYK